MNGMLIEVILVIIGFALIVAGAEFLIEGSSSLARRFGISEFIIGLTIVGMGTSAPEMVVSYIGALKGNSDIATGDVYGSNIFNILFVLGLTAVISPIAVSGKTLRKEIPICFAATALTVLLGMKHRLFGVGSDVFGRIEGLFFILLFAVQMILAFRDRKAAPETDTAESGSDSPKTAPIWKSILYVAAGFAGLIFGGQMIVDHAVNIARMLNVSDKFIAITLLAGGTSFPELATCVIAAFKKKDQLALGNILGSNIFNILLILGGAAIIHPLDFANINMLDTSVFVLSVILVWLSAYTWKKGYIDRKDGIVMVLADLAYLFFLTRQL